jgi:hypothetical protein
MTRFDDWVESKQVSKGSKADYWIEKHLYTILALTGLAALIVLIVGAISA